MVSRTDKHRQTKVKRIPYWVPDDNDGRGAWRYLPADHAHIRSAIVFYGEDGSPIGNKGVYEAKGWIPVHDIQMQNPEDPRLDLLPENWKQIGRGETRRAQWTDAQRKKLAQHNDSPPEAA